MLSIIHHHSNNCFLRIPQGMKNYLEAIVFIGVLFYITVRTGCEEFYVYNSTTVILEKCIDNSNKYKCSDGTCIFQRQYCDGIVNCESAAEDERDCNRCPLGFCQDSGGLCLNKSQAIDSWNFRGDEYVIERYCKIMLNLQMVYSVDCTGVGLTYISCFEIPPNILILNRNKIGMFNTLSDSTFLEHSQLEVLEFTHNNLTHLPVNVFQNLKNLKTLLLSYNRIERWDENIFENLHSLEYLNLHGNKIARLPRNIFRNLKVLKNLILSQNQIQRLDEDIFRNQSRMNYLYLQDNIITELEPKTFRSLKDLTNLYLDRNAIRYLDKTVFQNLSNLDYLSLESNNIEYLDENIFQDLYKLETLHLKDNEIASLPPNLFRNLQKLRILSLEGNRIRNLNEMVFQNLTALWILNLKKNMLFDLPNNIFQNLKSLGDLVLANNRIRYLDEAIFQNLTTLEHLNLAKNRISNLPAKVFKTLRSLKILWLTDNQIQQLDENVFKNLHNLHRCDLTRNNITYLPPNVLRDLKNLSFLRLNGNRIQHLDVPVFENLHSLQELFLQRNNIVYLPANLFRNLKNLTDLRLEGNRIQHLAVSIFESFHKLKSLHLNQNNIEYLPSNVFRNLKNLSSLYLDENGIQHLDELIFENQVMLEILNLSNNRITELPANMLKNSKYLERLYLENNNIEIIDGYSFSKLHRLLELNIKNNRIGDVDANIFKDLRSLRLLTADEFRFCCLKKEIKKCEAPDNEFSSCDDLLKDVLLRIFIWILGIISIIANLFVLYVRIKYQNDKTNKVNLFLIVNLAISDLIMGVYLLMIAITDVWYRGEYYLHDLPWRRSYWCGTAGVLSTFSSELTVFILTVISIDRLITIVFPFRTMRRGLSRTRILITLVWGLAAIISLLPHQIFQIPYFKNFYGRSSVCLALHITNETPDGWEYAVFVFIFLNATSFVLIAINYVLMYYHASKLKRGTITSSNQSSDTVMAVRMTLLVLADAACWIPIIVLGIRSLIGYSFPPEVYPWIAVFVLPLNAAMNPALYTISSVPLVIGVKWEKSQINGQPYLKCFWRGLQLNALQK